LGAYKGREDVVKTYIEPYSVRSILDIGCGPAEILSHLKDVDYYGFDISEEYITYARERYKERGKFFAKYICEDHLEWLPKFDLVLMYGVLHHIDDNEVESIFDLAYKALKPGGRLLTIDAAYDKGQSRVAKYLISKDRGKNVRTKEGYGVFINKYFKNNSVIIKHYKWVPYTHCIMEGVKP
jgi:SAM-dependent methyltransferase